MEDEHYTDDHHIEHLLFHRENDYDNIVNMDVERRYERLKVILEDTEKARGISTETKLSFKEYANEYKKLRECQYMCHSIQYKEGIFLDPHTNMALPDQKDDYGNIIKEEDMIASHHYFVSIDASKRTDKNFRKTFFELNKESFMNGYLTNIKKLIQKNEETLLTRLENNTISDRQAKQRKRELNELKDFEKKLTITDDIEYIDEWTPIAKLAMPMWKNKIAKDQKTIYDLFAVPMVLRYCSDTRKVKRSKAPYLIKFSFLTLEGNTKCSQRYLDFESLKEHGTDVEHQALMAKDTPDTWFEFLHEARKKKNKNKQRDTDTDGPKVFYYQGNKSRCLTYSLASAITYLIVDKIIYGVDHISTDLIEINQQDPQIVQKVNNIMRKNGYFTCKKLNKKKRKRNQDMDMLLDVDFEQNAIYVCSLITSLGDNLHTIAIVNGWIFDANFNKAIKLDRQALDECCKHNSIEATYVTCRDIWMFYPSKKICK